MGRWIYVLLFIFVILPGTSTLAQDLPVLERSLGFRLPEGRKSLSVPFELIDNLVVVNVIMNKTLPLKFIVDTGVRTSILTEKTFTDLLNVNYSRVINIPVPGGTQVIDAFVAPNINMNIGGLIGEGHALLVLENDLLELKNILGHNVQGILGYELFSRFVVEINYENRMITFFESEAFAKKNYARRRKIVQVPITIEDTKPYCYATLGFYDGNQLEAKLMLDTGASHSVLLDDESNDQIYLPENRIYSHLGRGLGGDIKGYIARIKSVDLGRFRFEDVIATFPEKRFYEQESTKTFRNGTLGGSIFSRFRITFDFMNGFVYLKKNRKFKKPFNYNLSGVVIKAHGLYLNTFEVISVRENSSAAKSGVREGDHIVRINGDHTSDMTLDEIQALFNSKPNRVLRLDLDRDGERIQCKFKLQKII